MRASIRSNKEKNQRIKHRKQQWKFNGTKSWFFDKINQVYNPLASLTKKKRKHKIPILKMK